MENEKEYTLHRKRAAADEDKMIARGSKAEILLQYQQMTRAQQEECSMMQGSMNWNHWEMDDMVQENRPASTVPPNSDPNDER